MACSEELVERFVYFLGLQGEWLRLKSLLEHECFRMRRYVARSGPWHRGKGLSGENGYRSWQNKRENPFERERMANVVDAMLTWTWSRN